ncbi:MAG: glycosyltransferase family protein [Magnetococcales bacterium]|nr:glycosyltransferase family protein [Magnetococcales bacterium]
MTAPVEPADPLAEAVRLHNAGCFAEAERLYRAHLGQNPADGEAVRLFGLLARDLGDLPMAERLLRLAHALTPQNAEPLDILGAILLEQNRPDEASDCFEQVLRREPQRAITWYHLGNARKRAGARHEAIRHYRHALSLAPDHPETHYNLANTLRETGQSRPALDHYRATLRLCPDHAAAHYNRSVVLMLTGAWHEGWREYEWRWRVPGFTTPAHASTAPLWDGAPLAGKTILLHAEQGLGDTVQFIRYLPRVAALGGAILLEVPSTLLRLVRSLDGMPLACRILTPGEPLPAHDCHAPLMSLPRLLNATPDRPKIPVPYLHADPSAVQRLRRRLDFEGGRTVGLCWAGNPDNPNDSLRSLPVALLAPLLEIPGIRFCALQHGNRMMDPTLPEWRSVVDLLSGSPDFAATAEAVAALDLILSVDTAIAHVAGALGKPVWLLLPFPAEWRWGESGHQTPWYPTMRLFRQSQSAGWQPLIARVSTALIAWSRHPEANPDGEPGAIGTPDEAPEATPPGF